LIDELWKQEENQGFAIVKLRHPRSAQSNLFAFSHGDKNVFEVNQLEDGKRCVRDNFLKTIAFSMTIVYYFFYIM